MPPPLSFSLYLSKALRYESKGHVEGTKTNGLPCSAPSLSFSALLFRSTNTKWSWHCAHVCTKTWGWLHRPVCSYINTQALLLSHNMMRPGPFSPMPSESFKQENSMKTIFWIFVLHGYCGVICFSLIMSKCRMSLFCLHSFSYHLSL